MSDLDLGATYSTVHNTGHPHTLCQVCVSYPTPSPMGLELSSLHLLPTSCCQLSHAPTHGLRAVKFAPLTHFSLPALPRPHLSLSSPSPNHLVHVHCQLSPMPLLLSLFPPTPANSPLPPQAVIIILLENNPKDKSWGAATRLMNNVDKFLERLKGFKASHRAGCMGGCVSADRMFGRAASGQAGKQPLGVSAKQSLGRKPWKVVLRVFVCKQTLRPFTLPSAHLHCPLHRSPPPAHFTLNPFLFPCTFHSDLPPLSNPSPDPPLHQTLHSEPLPPSSAGHH